VTAESPFERYRRLLIDSTPHLEANELKLDSRLADLGVDSISLLQLIVQLEEAFDLSLPDDAFSPETFESVESLWRVVSSLLESPDSAYDGALPSQLSDTSNGAGGGPG
jgi:acyl carrier protein